MESQQRHGTTPQMRGRYPDYDVLQSTRHWDPVTRRTVLARVAEVPPIRFFTESEARTLAAFCDIVTAQDAEPRIPVLQMVDAKLSAGQGDGYRYHDMPADGETWRHVAANLDRSARELHFADDFAAAGPAAQRQLVQRFAEGRLDWALPAGRAWGVVMRAVLGAFYSHPWAWNEIGFGGPAYPRGFARLGAGQRERWEKPAAVAPEPVSDPREHGLATPRPSADGHAERRGGRAGARLQSTLRVAAKGALRPPENDSAFLLDPQRRGVPGREHMRHYRLDDPVDMLIVGAGAGGATLAQRLARRGWRVLVLEAGPFWDPDSDWVSDEAGSQKLYWTEDRIIGGEDPVELGKNNSGRGVGGSMIHYAGYTPRFHPSDFETQTLDGVGADWPISYADLKPHYQRLERELPVAGQWWPWGDPHGYPYGPHPIAGGAQLSWEGARRLGIEMRVGPVGITNGSFGNRPHCIYRGYCLQGCKVGAKASPLITHIPDALAHGVEVRADCMVTRIEVNEAGRVTGVRYCHKGQEHFQHAAAVTVAGYAIETPRLLLNSTSQRYPLGLANNDDQVGRRVMVQGAPQVAGRFPQELRMYKAPPPEITSEQFYETDPQRGFARGFAIQTVGPLPIAWAEHVLAVGHWGEALREYVRDYNHWYTLGVLAELLPRDENRVTLADVTDANGMPVARLDYTQCDNDRANIACAKRTLRQIMTAAGAQEILTVDRYAHLVGGCTMSSSPETGVVDADHRAWGVPNLFVCDGSVMPTQGSANPALTIMALASRLADRLADKRVDDRGRRHGKIPFRAVARG